ncbi:MAG: hypothetical protein AB8E82_08890 [Aureispira sp.]
MKRLFLLPIISLCILQACQPSNSDKELNKHGPVHHADEQPIVVLTKNKGIVEQDTLIRLSIDASTSSELEIMACKSLIEQLRNVEEESIEPAEVTVPLLALGGQTVTESTALLFLINQDTLKLYVDYFEGDLIGSKVFYVVGGNLLAVDILTMNAYQTESGPQAQSLLTHTFYYKKEALLFCTTHHYPDKQAVLEEENLQDWAIIQQRLQLF